MARIVALELHGLPYSASNPEVLPPVDNILLKHAVIVANAIPATR